MADAAVEVPGDDSGVDGGGSVGGGHDASVDGVPRHCSADVAGAELLEADLARGQHFDPSAGRVTFQEWAEQWLRRPGKRANSIARDRQALAVFMPDLGPRGLGSITSAHVQTTVDARRALVSPATLTRDVAALRAVLNAAVDAELIGRSPARRVALPRVRPPERTLLGPAELVRLADAVPPRYRALVLVGGVLGLRWGEAIALRVADVDFMRRTVTVAQVVEEVAGHIRVMAGEAKTEGSLRTLAAPTFLIDELNQHLANHRSDVVGDRRALLFVGPQGGILRRRFAERTFRPAVERAGLDASLTFHGLRHVAMSTLVEANVHPRVMQGRAGHSSSKLTMELYAHVSDDADRRAAEALEDRFRETLSSRTGTQRARGTGSGPTERRRCRSAGVTADGERSTDNAEVDGSTPSSPTAGTEGTPVQQARISTS
ncbi:MAG: tyrosine-type recombinase/integrase [Acidimicrobiales bacterium]